MVVPDRTSIGMDRRVSTRLSVQSEYSTDDEYALAALGISDGGYRPAGQTAAGDQLGPQSGGSVVPPRPSSTTKPRYDSFALRHDGEMGTIVTRPVAAASTSTPLPINRSSTESTDVTIRPESLYQGPSAPSHPYQMYPQQARLARTASVATASTAQVSEMSYTGASVPAIAQSYRSDQSAPIMPLAPPVGFPGRNDNYQRRLGPDGEEIADLIGPDGHTEQLPPYTQYADEAVARKTRPNVHVVVPGAGGMGLATRNPEFASREDLSSPQSQQLAAPSIMSERQLTTPVAEVPEKPRVKRWQQIARRKVCGIIPVWVFVLIAICFVLFGIILGTVLALLKPPPKPKKQSHNNYNNQGSQQEITITTEVTTTTLDAKPFQTLPAGIAALPTGSFILPVTVPAVAPASCVVDNTKSFVWGCQIQPFLDYEISISTVPGKDELSNNQINLDFKKDTTGFLPYGAQPPVLNQAKGLRLVNESQNPDKGPAWFFQMSYNKVVILPEGALTAPVVSQRSTSQHRRGNGQSRGPPPGSGFTSRKGITQPGEKPWFCYWNDTLLETFIYVNKESSTGAKAFPSGRPPAPSSGIYGNPSPSPTGTGTSIFPSSVPTITPSQSPYPNMGPSFYPKLVKLVERRVPLGDKHVDPYCVQHTANADGTYQPVLDATGKPTTIILDELELTTKPTLQGRSDVESRGIIVARDDASCGCLWLI